MISSSGAMVSNVGAEVGRVAGGQAAAIAAAEKLAEMDMATITEEKALEMKQSFVELGEKIGGESGAAAGRNAASDMEADALIKSAEEATRKAAEQAAMKAKAVLDVLMAEVDKLGAQAGEPAGKVSMASL